MRSRRLPCVSFDPSSLITAAATALIPLGTAAFGFYIRSSIGTAINEKMAVMLASITGKFDALTASMGDKFEALTTSTSTKFDALTTSTSTKFDALKEQLSAVTTASKVADAQHTALLANHTELKARVTQMAHDLYESKGATRPARTRPASAGGQ
jgi:hypothetical protein